MAPAGLSDTLHASAIAIQNKGLLILGASGTGKSSLALELIALGATLISDDGVEVRADGRARLVLSAPDSIAGLIEARGIGLLRLPHAPAAAAAVVTLDQTETARLPEAHETVINGVALPLLHKVESPAFPAMLLAYLTGARIQP